MKECNIIQVITPKKLILSGFWFGPQSPKRVLIFVHGLTSNAFSGHELVLPLVDVDTAVITFNNRGHDKIARMKRVDMRKKKGHVSLMMGEAHEIFVDCVDDIQGVVDYARNRGVNDIILVGHSTGSQKSAYYLSNKGKQKQIKGVVLLSPLSDYAGALYQDKNGMLSTATKVAQTYVEQGKAHSLLPVDIWPQMHDAQRFLSLFTSNSEEEIFPYCQKNKLPKKYHLVRIPQLVVLGEKDESRDRNIRKIAQWFEKNAQSKKKTISIIKNAPHSFFQYENEVVKQIRNFINENSL